MNTTIPILIRADASTTMGTGHVLRCITLAQAWLAKKGNVIFITAMQIPKAISNSIDNKIKIHEISAEPGSNQDAQMTLALARRYQTAWVVIDGYHFNANYQKTFKDAQILLFTIDDFGHCKNYYANYILNQNLHAEANLYQQRSDKTQLLLGTKYALLRDEFLDYSQWQRSIPIEATNILITLGGSDPENVTLKVIQALQKLPANNFHITIVVGSCNPHLNSLKQAAKQTVQNINIKQNVANMSELMAEADLVISAGGTTCWEIAFMGLPAIVLILADNQKPIAESFDKIGLAINLGYGSAITIEQVTNTIQHLSSNIALRKNMSAKGRGLVDGKGSYRVTELLKKEIIAIRTVTQSDCETLFNWTNESDVRKASFSTHPISWEEHCRWFNTKISDPNCLIFIATYSNTPIAQIRFNVDRGKNEAEISLSLCKTWRGLGYGDLIIQLALEQFFKHNHIDHVHAYIKQNNFASIRVFTKAAFEHSGEAMIKNHKCLDYVYTNHSTSAIHGDYHETMHYNQ